MKRASVAVLRRIHAFFLRWWNKEPRQPLNLLQPDVLAEIAIHIMPSGDRKMFCSKLPPQIPINTLAMIAQGVTQSGIDFIAQYANQMPPEALGGITQSMVQNALNFGKQHGIEIQFSQGKK